MLSLRGKVGLISGASSGIGRALARLCAREGMILAICGRDRARLEALAQELAVLGAPKVFFKAFSLENDDDLARFLVEVKESLGDVEIFVNNAGLNSGRNNVEDIDLARWDEMMTVNVRAPLCFLQGVIPAMKERKSGHIVNILSTVCLFAGESLGAYTASKHAIRGLSGVLRKELRPFNVRVTDILPGGVNTAFRPQDRPEYMSPESVAEIIMNALKSPEDICCHEIVLRPMIETNMP